MIEFEDLKCPICSQPLSNIHFGWGVISYRCNNSECSISDVIIVIDYDVEKGKKKKKGEKKT